MENAPLPVQQVQQALPIMTDAPVQAPAGISDGNLPSQLHRLC